jgi:hypothetical protein
MGGGATIAPAVAVGYESIAVELDADYVETAKKAIPRLATLDREKSRDRSSATRRKHANGSAHVNGMRAQRTLFT